MLCYVKRLTNEIKIMFQGSCNKLPFKIIYIYIDNYYVLLQPLNWIICYNLFKIINLLSIKNNDFVVNWQFLIIEFAV